MLSINAGTASKSGRIAAFSVSNFRAARQSLTGAPMVLRTFEWLGQCGVSLACFIFGLVLVTSTTASLFAQTAGQVTGHVSDPSGAAVPNATITLKNVATSGVRSTVTTDAGDYTFGAVPPGVYDVQAAKSGFKTATTPNVQLSVQQTIRVDFELAIGATSQEVIVRATGMLLQAENATIGTVIENQAISQLPLNGRNYLSLAALTSNANTYSPMQGQAGAREGGTRATQSISVGGQRIMFNHYTLDGVNNTDVDFNSFVAQPPIDAIQEFKVQTGVYPAEFGHQATQVNVLTKSGTNNFHGSGFEFIRNDYWDANQYYFTPVHSAHPFKWNDYGFELAGPVTIPKVVNGKNRLFFMASAEWLKLRQSSQANASVPTLAMQMGDFSDLRDKNGKVIPIYDPATYDATTGLKQQISCNGVLNVICPGRISNISKNFLNYYATPNQAVSPGISTLKSTFRDYVYNSSAPSNHYIFTVRADYVQSPNMQWSFRYSPGNDDQSTTGLAGSGTKIVSHFKQWMGSNTWTISPTIVNDARFGYTSFTNSLGMLSAYTNDVVSKIGVPGLQPGDPSTWGIPQAGYVNDGFTGIGDTNDGPYVINDANWTIVDNLTWVKGKHTFQVGFEFDHQKFNQVGNQFSRGVFSFQPNATAQFTGGKAAGGDAFAEFLLGDVYQTTVALQVAQFNMVRNNNFAYAQDTYKVKPNLSLSLGLRYELVPPFYDTMGNLFNIAVPQLFDRPTFGYQTTNNVTTATATPPPLSEWPYYVRQGACNDPYAGLSIRWVNSDGTPVVPAPRCSGGQFPPELLDTQYTNFAPRLSLSYSPTPTTVVRTGFGVFYSQDIGNAYFDMARTLGARVTAFSGQGAGSAPGVPTIFWNNAVPNTGGGVIANVPPPYGLAMKMSHRTPYTLEYQLDIQKQIGANWMFEISYLGNKSGHLYGFLNANQTIPCGYIPPPPGAPAGVTDACSYGLTINQRSPFGNFGVIQDVSDTGIAWYNALSLKANKRISSGFSLVSSYTFSKSTDDTSGIRTQQSPLFPQNSNCQLCDYGLSDFDVRHRFTAGVIYDLPAGPGKLVNVSGALNQLIGGWQANSLMTIQGGFPGSPNELYRGNFSGSNNCCYDRPDAVAGQNPYVSNPTPNRWFNPDAFVLSRQGYYGNAGRNSLEGPGLIAIDAAIHKDIHMPYNENHLLQIRIEAFNVFNHPNWGMPDLVPAGAGGHFGVVGSTATDMRELQFGAKYVF